MEGQNDWICKKEIEKKEKGENFSADKTSSPAIKSVKWWTMISVSSIIQSNQATKDAMPIHRHLKSGKEY